MSFPDRISRWASIAQSEIQRLNLPFPVDYVLGILQRESNGTSGAVNKSSGASGLMQIMPITLKDYNQRNGTNYTMAQLRDPNRADLQIRVGVWVLKTFMRSAFNYLKKRLSTVPLDDLVRVTDTFYAAGPGNSRKKLDKIVPTWANVVSTYPSWDRIKPAELVWQRSNDSSSWDLPAVDQWLGIEIDDEKKKQIGGALVALLIIAIALMSLKKK